MSTPGSFPFRGGPMLAQVLSERADEPSPRSAFRILWRLDAACMLAAGFWPTGFQPGIMDRSLGPAAGYMSKSERSGIDRRNFLKSAVAGAAAVAATGAASTIGSAGTPPEAAAVQSNEVLTTARTGSDFIMDVLKTL